MLNLKPILPEHEALMNVVIRKINDLYMLQDLFEPSEDKLLAGMGLKTAAMYMNTLILNGQIKQINPPEGVAPPPQEDQPPLSDCLPGDDNSEPLDAA